MAGIIAGNPRSGTSLTMNLSAEAVGEDRIIGERFPMLKNQFKEKLDWESEKHFQIRSYIQKGFPENSEEAIQKTIDLNPNGFFEHPLFTVRGIRFRPDLKEDFKKLEEEDKSRPYIIKLVNSGLYQSDPKYVDWVVYLLRHPWDIAKSQENLKRDMKITLKNGKQIDLFKGIKVNDPHFFISSTIQYGKWRLENPGKPVLQILFDDLISNPAETLENIADFTGIEEYKNVSGIIDPKLKRSGQDHEYRPGIWEEALNLYDLVLKEDFEAIKAFSENKHTWSFKRNQTLFCPRIRVGLAYDNCYSCRREENPEFIRSCIARAEVNGWNWKAEPCAFECGIDLDDPNPLTIEESIKNNHWLKFEKIDPDE